METIYVNGCEGYYVNMYNQDGQIISWDNGDYVMSKWLIISKKP